MKINGEHIFFVTGTDTDCGKTLVTCALLAKARQLKFTIYGIKPVASGCTNNSSNLENSDALFISSTMTTKLAYQNINPIAFEPAIAPHLAAKQEGIKLSSKFIIEKCQQLIKAHSAEFTLIEGAGGWRVPLDDDTKDYLGHIPLKMNIPVILVVGMKLGCLNHAILTAESIAQDGAKISGWIANQVDPDMSHAMENLDTLKKLLSYPFLGYIPFLNSPNFRQASKYLDLDALIKASQ